MKNFLCVIFTILLISACSDPGETFAYRMDLARQALNEGRYDEAIDRFKNLEKEDPYGVNIKFAIGLSMLLRDVYDRHGSMLDAEKSAKPLEYIKAAVDISPDHDYYALSYAGFLSDVGRHEEAILYFEKYYKKIDSVKSYVTTGNEQVIYVAYAKSLLEMNNLEKSSEIINDLEMRYLPEELGDPIKEKLTSLKEEINKKSRQ